MSSQPETNRPILQVGETEATTVGNYFVANYPPFSFWNADATTALDARLDEPPAPETPLGLYVHIPFCRKRCDFCYFRVYTDKNSGDVRRYLDAVLAELRLYADRPLLRGRKPTFVYFGGGTPSYLSVDQLTYLFDGMRELLGWDAADEITFECEPGTLQEKKLEALHAQGVTRLSLGVENYDPEILELNNRAHRAKEIDRAYGFARSIGFPQINIDLIAGMVGETDENWRRCIERSLEQAPESITLYQMEIPYNTTVYRRMQDGGREVAPVADWGTKRRWVDEAFTAWADAGYVIGSAYTVKKSNDVQFAYRDGLWHGADLLGLGVSSFGQLGGIHAQNAHHFEDYITAVESGQLPLKRGYVLDADERLVREFVLQLKIGRLDTSALSAKFGVDVIDRFRAPLAEHERGGWLQVDGATVTLTRDGLLQVDRLLPAFFHEAHRGARYA